MRYMLVAAGGALGSVARYALDGFILRLASPFFRSGTFVVNTIGCLVFGVIIEIVDAAEKVEAFVRDHLDQMVQEGLVTLERAEVIMYRDPEKPRA